MREVDIRKTLLSFSGRKENSLNTKELEIFRKAEELAKKQNLVVRYVGEDRVIEVRLVTHCEVLGNENYRNLIFETFSKDKFRFIKN